MRRVRRTRVLLLLAVAALVLTSCAAGSNPQESVADAGGDVAGFWLGVWHGLIALITFLISLFSDSITLYEVHNNGNRYDAGFMIGIFVLGGGGVGASKRRR